MAGQEMAPEDQQNTKAFVESLLIDWWHKDGRSRWIAEVLGEPD